MVDSVSSISELKVKDTINDLGDVRYAYNLLTRYDSYLLCLPTWCDNRHTGLAIDFSSDWKMKDHVKGWISHCTSARWKKWTLIILIVSQEAWPPCSPNGRVHGRREKLRKRSTNRARFIYKHVKVKMTNWSSFRSSRVKFCSSFFFW